MSLTFAENTVLSKGIFKKGLLFGLRIQTVKQKSMLALKRT